MGGEKGVHVTMCACAFAKTMNKNKKKLKNVLRTRHLVENTPVHTYILHQVCNTRTRELPKAMVVVLDWPGPNKPLTNKP